MGGGGSANSLDGTRLAREQARTRSWDVRVDIPLTLAGSGDWGVEKKVTMKLLNPCDVCTGTGAEPGSRVTTCTTCRGSGEVRRAQQSFFGSVVSVSVCPTCAGDGKIVASPCKKCRGEGRVRGEDQIAIKIPAGVATGQYMTMRGIGNAGPRNGGRGDIQVVFEVEEDDRFERDGEDLYTEVLVTYPQLVIGADVGGADCGGERDAPRASRDAEWAGHALARTWVAASQCVWCWGSARAAATVDARFGPG